MASVGGLVMDTGVGDVKASLDVPERTAPATSEANANAMMGFLSVKALELEMQHKLAVAQNALLARYGAVLEHAHTVTLENTALRASLKEAEGASMLSSQVGSTVLPRKNSRMSEYEILTVSEEMSIADDKFRATPHSRRGGMQGARSFISDMNDSDLVLWPEWQIAAVDRQTSFNFDKLPAMQTRSINVANVITCSWPLHPSSMAKLSWDIAAIFCVACDFITIPLMVFDMPYSLVLQVLQMSILTFWTLDMVVSTVTGYFNRSGALVMEPRRIVVNYLKTWFLLDLIIVGVDWVLVAVDIMSNEGVQRSGATYARLARSMRFLRVIRSMRMFRAMKAREIVSRLHEHIDSEYIAISYNVLLNVLTLLMISHIMACVFFWVGSQGARENNWIEVNVVDQLGPGQQYLMSLHWALAQFTPAGMPVQPTNEIERLYAVVVIVLGIIFFSTFLSTVTAGMTRLRNLRSQETVDAFQLRRFLKVHKISNDLTSRVLRYIEIAKMAHKKNIPSGQVAHLRFLSGPLNIELQKEIYAPYLERHPFFIEYASCSAAALSHFCATLEMLGTSQRDTLFSAHNCADGCFVIVSGSMAYVRDQELQQGSGVERVAKRSWLCEAVLWVQWVHRGDMRALTECELVKINAARFREVTTAHRSVTLIATEYAHKFATRLQTMLDVGGCVDDLVAGTGESDHSQHVDKAYATTTSMLDRDVAQELEQADLVEVQLMQTPGLTRTRTNDFSRKKTTRSSTVNSRYLRELEGAVNGCSSGNSLVGGPSSTESRDDPGVAQL